MKRLLFITPELPYPPQSGGKVKSLKLLDSLAERYEVTLVSPLKMQDHSHRLAFESRSPCDQHLHRRLDVPRSAKSLIASYLRGQALNVYRSYDQSLAEQVERIAPDYDLIFIDHYEVASYIPRDFAGKVIYHAHNAYHQLWDRYARLPGNPITRLAAFMEARRVRRAELSIARRADLVFAAPNDGACLARGGINEEKIAPTYHLGDDSQLDLPPLSYDGTQKRLMYVGFLGWEANVVGLLWFIENVWPSLLAAHPDLQFHIIGKDADERLEALAAIYPGIRLCGFVEDLEQEYSQARVSVAPLLFGSGMKVKVLDAMARGMPTVTTPVGAEGIDYIDGEHLAVAASAQEMANAVLGLLGDDQRWRRLSLGSRKLVNARYTWRALFEAMHRRLDKALDQAQADPTTTRDIRTPLQHA